MDVKTVDYYGACDQAIQAMNRSNLEAFGRLKLAKWDEIHPIRTVTAMYRKSAKKARQRYYEVAFEAYLLAMAICGVEPGKAHRMAEKTITGEWVDMILAQTDFVTLYRFDTETDRKAHRLAEALEDPEKRNAEIDKALRFWSMQLGQYAINFTDYAVIAAYDDAGALMAEWVTQKDARVCHECHALGGQVFPIEMIPAKPHWGCRCRLKPVFHGKDE